MKTLSKITFSSFLLGFVVALPGCGEDEFKIPNEFCGDQTIELAIIDEEIGRIYYYSDPAFYYIGNIDPTLSNGGYVPCNGIPKAYVPVGNIGALVRFGGNTKHGLTDEGDPTDPLFLGIDLSSIEKLEEESQ